MSSYRAVEISSLYYSEIYTFDDNEEGNKKNS